MEKRRTSGIDAVGAQPAQICGSIHCPRGMVPSIPLAIVRTGPRTMTVERPHFHLPTTTREWISEDISTEYQSGNKEKTLYVKGQRGKEKSR